MAELFDEGELPFLLHLCGGNEDQLIEIFSKIKDEDYVFSTHRTHYHYLLKGGSTDKLESFIRNGDSMHVFDNEVNFLSSSIVAGNAAIAAGLALSMKLEGSNQHVWCFLGDGAEEEGHFYEAAKFVESADLPCTFIIEDNDRSVNSSIKDRNLGGTFTVPWETFTKHIIKYKYNPTYPHVSSGSGKWVKFKPWSRNEN